MSANVKKDGNFTFLQASELYSNIGNFSAINIGSNSSTIGPTGSPGPGGKIGPTGATGNTGA